MSASALISVSEYLNTTYRPDQEMLEGYLAERNLGEYDHSNLQGALVERRAYVCMHGDFRGPREGILGIPESPVRISLPDLFANLD